MATRDEVTSEIYRSDRGRGDRGRMADDEAIDRARCAHLGAGAGQGVRGSALVRREGAKVVLGDVIVRRVHAVADSINENTSRVGTRRRTDVTRPEDCHVRVSVAER